MSSGTESPSPIRVLVADDYPMMRRSIEIVCATDPNLEIAAQVGDGEAAVEKCLELKPDVMVLDLMLPRLDGFGVTRRLKEEGCPTKILILTGRDDPGALLEAMRLGVAGYLDKTDALDDLGGKITAIAQGERLFSEKQEQAALGEFGAFVRRARAGSSVGTQVTSREREVLAMIAQGLTTTQMGRRLGLSARTVESHIHSLYGKLEVKSRVQAVVRARDLGLLREEPSDS